VVWRGRRGGLNGALTFINQETSTARAKAHWERASLSSLRISVRETEEVELRDDQIATQLAVAMQDPGANLFKYKSTSIVRGVITAKYIDLAIGGGLRRQHRRGGAA
jgi:hypothetical protein